MGLQDQYKLRDVLTQDTILLLRKLFTDGVVVNSSSSGLSLESTLQDVLSKLIELEIDINDKNVTFLKNGIQSNVVEDDVTPANNIPLPVKLTSVTGDINITAGDLNVNLSDKGVDYDITRIGNGTNELSINADGSINSVTSATITDRFSIARVDSSADTKYYGFLDANGNWYIMREVTSTGVFTYYYSTSTTDFTGASGWSNRTSITYVEFNIAF